MSAVEEIADLVRKLPENAQAEVRDFAQFLMDRQSPRPEGEMRRDNIRS